MTILRFKNPTNMYRIDARKTRRWASILCSRRSTDQIKVFKIQYVDSWGRVKWREKNPRRNKRKNARGRSAGWVKCRCLGASHSGAEPLAGYFPVPRTSAPVTLAPSQGSISGILSARGLFERNFRKKGQIVKNSARRRLLRINKLIN